MPLPILPRTFGAAFRSLRAGGHGQQERRHRRSAAFTVPRQNIFRAVRFCGVDSNLYYILL